MTPQQENEIRTRLKNLGLQGCLARFDELIVEPWLPRLIDLEDDERSKRSLEYRFKAAKLDKFKHISEFDWSFPKKIDKPTIMGLFSLEFMKDAENIVFIGPNGVGKTIIAKNLAQKAIERGFTAHFVEAGPMLAKLAGLQSSYTLDRWLKFFARPDLLIIDEVGYLNYTDAYADLFFQLINRRYLKKSTIITTNKPFSQWSETFPNASCVVTLIDRLCHKAEITSIEGPSYRLKESQDRMKEKKLKGKSA